MNESKNVRKNVSMMFTGMVLSLIHISCTNSSGTGASVMPTSSGRSAPAFPKTSTTTATLLFEAIRLCWMASSLSTVRQCRR